MKYNFSNQYDTFIQNHDAEMEEMRLLYEERKKRAADDGAKDKSNAETSSQRAKRMVEEAEKSYKEKLAIKKDRLELQKLRETVKQLRDDYGAVCAKMDAQAATIQSQKQTIEHLNKKLAEQDLVEIVKPKTIVRPSALPNKKWR